MPRIGYYSGVNKPHKVALCWFRRSVRLDDNRALNYAVENATHIVPFFVLDKKILDHPSTGKARTGFLFDALADVDRSLRKRGGRLIIRHGKPLQEIERLIEESGAALLTFGRDYEPYSRERDTSVVDALTKQGIEVQTFSDHLLREPDEIESKSGTPYTVFTPYKRVWFDKPFEMPCDAPKKILVPADLHGEELPKIDIGDQKPRVIGGENEAEKWLSRFLSSPIADYETDRNLPALEGTSRLSAYLRMGVLSPRRALQSARAVREELEVGRRGGIDSWLSELAWRDFYYQILWQHPQVAGHSFRPQFEDVVWENNDDYFAAWCDGRTGYPIVDAAMRQMNRQAWMHNRARMIVASFLTKDLLNDWRRGELYFMQKLIDGDLASNNGGWQWAAGTGTDAQPFFRIFNPTSQGEKFDPQGDYVKEWIPELKRVPAKYIHKPWELSALEQEAVGCVLGRDYPHPIVDHKTQRDRALQLYRAAGAKDQE